MNIIGEIEGSNQLEKPGCKTPKINKQQYESQVRIAKRLVTKLLHPEYPHQSAPPPIDNDIPYVPDS